MVVSRLQKAEVQFEHPAKGRQHCAECLHFKPPHACVIVMGKIEDGDWCNHYRRDRTT